MAKKESFKESWAECRTMIKGVDAKKFASIYLLMGEESFFIDMIANHIIDSALSEDEKEFNLATFYGKDADVGDVINCAKRYPMVSQFQVVILREAQQLKKIEQLVHYLKAPLNSTILIICHKEKSLDKRSALYKQFVEKGVVFESVKPRDYEVGEWVNDLISSKGLKADPQAVAMIADHLGVDLTKISNEIDKLMTRLDGENKVITADIVEKNIGISKEYNNFELTKALSEKNLSKALTIIEYFASNSKKNPSILTIAAIFNHFQKIFILNYQKWLSAKKNTQMPDDMTLVRMMKLTNSFFLKEYHAAAQRYPNQKVFNIFKLIRETDMKLKGMNTGSDSEREIMRELILKIIMA